MSDLKLVISADDTGLTKVEAAVARLEKLLGSSSNLSLAGIDKVAASFASLSTAIDTAQGALTSIKAQAPAAASELGRTATAAKSLTSSLESLASVEKGLTAAIRETKSAAVEHLGVIRSLSQTNIKLAASTEAVVGVLKLEEAEYRKQVAVQTAIAAAKDQHLIASRNLTLEMVKQAVVDRELSLSQAQSLAGSSGQVAALQAKLMATAELAAATRQLMREEAEQGAVEAALSAEYRIQQKLIAATTVAQTERVLAAKAETRALADQLILQGKLSKERAEEIISLNAQAQATNRLAASQRTAHDAMRGAAGASGKLWLSYGNMGVMIGSFAAAAAAIKEIKLGSEFEHITNYTMAIADSTGQATLSLKDLRTQLLDIKNTPFNATELAGSAKELVKAGFDAASSVRELDSVSKLAAISEENLSEVTKAVASQYRTWGEDSVGTVRGVKDMTDAANRIGYAASASALDVGELNDMLKYTPQLASTTNISFSEMLGALANLSNMGVRGSSAATALRTSIQKLYDPSRQAEKILRALGKEFSAFDKEGRAKPFAETMDQLFSVLKDLSDHDRTKVLDSLFNLRAASGGISLLRQMSDAAKEGKFAFVGLSEGIDQAGKSGTYLKETYDKVSQSTSEQFKLMSADVQRELIKAFDAEPVQGLIAMVRQAAEDGSLLSLFNGISSIASALISATLATGDFLSEFKGLTSDIRTLLGMFGDLPEFITGTAGIGLVGAMIFGGAGGALVAAGAAAVKATAAAMRQAEEEARQGMTGEGSGFGWGMAVAAAINPALAVQARNKAYARNAAGVQAGNAGAMTDRMAYLNTQASHASGAQLAEINDHRAVLNAQMADAAGTRGASADWLKGSLGGGDQAWDGTPSILKGGSAGPRVSGGLPRFKPDPSHSGNTGRVSIDNARAGLLAYNKALQQVAKAEEDARYAQEKLDNSFAAERLKEDLDLRLVGQEDYYSKLEDLRQQDYVNEYMHIQKNIDIAKAELEKIGDARDGDARHDKQLDAQRAQQQAQIIALEQRQSEVAQKMARDQEADGKAAMLRMQQTLDAMEDFDKVTRRMSRDANLEHYFARLGDGAANFERSLVKIKDEMDDKLEKLTLDKAPADVIEGWKALYEYRIEATKRLHEIQQQTEGDWKAGMESGLRSYLEKSKDVYSEVKDLAMDSFRSIEDGLTKALMGGVNGFKDLGKIATQILNDIMSQIIRMAIIRPAVQSLAGGVLGSISMPNMAGGAVNGVMSGGGGAGGGMSLGSLFNASTSWSGIQNGLANGAAWLGMGSTGLSSTGVSAFTNTASSLGYDAVGLSGLSAGGGSTGLAGTISGMDPSMFGGITAGLGSIAMSLLSGQGLTAQTGLQAVGATIGGMTPLGPLGAMIGGFIGNFVGGLFGSKGAPKTGGASWSDYTSATFISDHQSDKDMGRLAAEVQTSFESLAREVGIATKGLQLGLGFSADPGGDAQTIVGSGVRDASGKVIWQNNHEDVGRSEDEIRAGLEAESKKVLLAALQTLDVTPLADYVLDQVDMTAATSDSVDRMLEFVKSANSISEAFKSIGMSADELVTALKSGVIDPSMFTGGDVWQLLTDTAKQSLQDSISKASADIAAGNVDLATQTLTGIQQYVDKVKATNDEINAVIEDSKLSDQEKALRAVDEKYAQFSDTLEQNGIVVAATNLQQAKQIEIQKVLATTTRRLTDAEAERADRLKAEREAAAKASEITSKVTESWDSLMKAQTDAKLKSEGGSVGGVMMTGAEAEKYSAWLDHIDLATESLKELEKLGQPTKEMRDALEKATTTLAGQIKDDRLLAGDWQGAFTAGMRESAPEGLDKMTNAQVNTALMLERVHVALGLVADASRNALKIPNVGAAISGLMQASGRDSYEFRNYIKESELGIPYHVASVDYPGASGLRDKRALDLPMVGRGAATPAEPTLSLKMLGTDTNAKVHYAPDVPIYGRNSEYTHDLLNILTDMKIRGSYSPEGQGVAGIMAARAQQGNLDQIDGPIGLKATYERSLVSLKSAFDKGKFSAEEYARAVNGVNAAVADYQEFFDPEVLAEARYQATVGVGHAGLSSLRYYFDQIGDSVKALAAEAEKANEPIAQASSAIGRLNSVSYVMAESTRAMIQGFSAVRPDDYVNQLTRQGALDGIHGEMIGTAAQLLSDIVTTADAAQAAEQLKTKDSFAKTSAAGVRDASLLIDGIGQYDSQGLENAFLRLNDALVKGTITEEQYVDLLAVATDTYQGVTAEAEKMADSFKQIRESALKLVDALLASEETTYLSADQRFAELQRQFNADIASAAKGDTSAMNDLDGSSRALLAAGRDRASSLLEFQAFSAATIDKIRPLETVQASPVVTAVNKLEIKVDALKNELVGLRTETRQNVISANQFAKILAKWDNLGLPATAV